MRKKTTRYTDTLRNGDRKHENASNFLASKRLNARILEKLRKQSQEGYFVERTTKTSEMLRKNSHVHLKWSVRQHLSLRKETVLLKSLFPCLFVFFVSSFFFLDGVHVTQGNRVQKQGKRNNHTTSSESECIYKNNH